MDYDLEKIKESVSKNGWENGFGLTEDVVDWLIEQTEKVEKYKKALKDIHETRHQFDGEATKITKRVLDF